VCLLLCLEACVCCSLLFIASFLCSRNLCFVCSFYVLFVFVCWPVRAFAGVCVLCVRMTANTPPRRNTYQKKHIQCPCEARMNVSPLGRQLGRRGRAAGGGFEQYFFASLHELRRRVPVDLQYKLVTSCQHQK
jgi:hypothetical protein